MIHTLQPLPMRFKLLSRLREKCDHGENQGKPGPCPENKPDESGQPQKPAKPDEHGAKPAKPDEHDTASRSTHKLAESAQAVTSLLPRLISNLGNKQVLREIKANPAFVELRDALSIGYDGALDSVESWPKWAGSKSQIAKNLRDRATKIVRAVRDAMTSNDWSSQGEWREQIATSVRNADVFPAEEVISELVGGKTMERIHASAEQDKEAFRAGIEKLTGWQFSDEELDDFEDAAFRRMEPLRNELARNIVAYEDQIEKALTDAVRVKRLRRPVLKSCLEQRVRYRRLLKCMQGPNAGKPGVCPENRPDAAAGSKPHGGTRGIHQLVELGSMTWDKLKAAGHKAADVEHAAKEYVTSGVEKNVSRLPARLQSVVRGAWVAVRFGVKTAFATYTAGQAMVEEVAKERGATPEAAQHVRDIVSRWDALAYKPVQLGVGAVAGPGVGVAASFVPLGSLTYLATSTGRNPLATARAARNLVKRALGRKHGRRQLSKKLGSDRRLARPFRRCLRSRPLQGTRLCGAGRNTGLAKGHRDCG